MNNELCDKPVKVFYRMQGSDKIMSDDEYPIQFVNYSKIEKILQESTIWFPKHERTNDIPPAILEKIYSDNSKDAKVNVTQFVKPVDKSNSFIEPTYSKDPAPESLRKQCMVDQYPIASFSKSHIKENYEEYRACFKCGERGHLLATCPYVRNKRHEVEMKQRHDYPVDNYSYPQRRFFPQPAPYYNQNNFYKKRENRPMPYDTRNQITPQNP